MIGAIVLLVVVLLWYGLSMTSAGAADEAAIAAEVEHVFLPGGPAKKCLTMDELRAAERSWLDHSNACRTGVRNDSAGYGANKGKHPHDCPPRTRNGSYLPPAKIAAAEQQAWAPYTPDASCAFDPKKGSYAGSDLTQQLGQNQTCDWNEQLNTLAVDARTRENHRKWANEVGPHSQGAFTVDNLDEAVAMGTKRHGITAFRAHTPAQTSNTLFVTENDAELHAEHFSKMYF